MFVLSVCGLTHHIIIVAPMLLPAAALAECKHHRVLRLIGDLPVTRSLNPNISRAKPPPLPRSDPSRPLLCVLRGPNPGSVINFAQAVKHGAAVQLEQHLPPLPLPPPGHPRGPTLLQEILLMSTTGLGSRIKTQQPGPDPLLPLTAARSSA